jgi:hypothetical protein
MKPARFLIAIGLCTALPVFAQVEVDQSIHLTGSGGNGRLTGIKEVSDPEDAISAQAFQLNSATYVEATNSGNSYSTALSPAAGGYEAGLIVHFRSPADNSGPSTLNVNSLGPKNIYKNFNQPLAAGDIRDGQMVSVIYDGSGFQMISPTGNSGSGTAETRGAFVTSVTYNGNLGGISGADGKCQARADAAGLSGTWIAWISSSSAHAKDRSAYSGAITTINGDLVSNDGAGWAGLTGSILSEIIWDEFGNYVNDEYVWTGTQANGLATINHCINWTSSSSGGGTTGNLRYNNSGWTESSGSGCSSLHRLYCFQQ